MKIVKKLVVFALAFSMMLGLLSLTAYAESYPNGYIVRTTVETVETVNGVVVNRKVDTYDSPVQYGQPPQQYGQYGQPPQPQQAPPPQPAPNQWVAPAESPNANIGGGYGYYGGYYYYIDKDGNVHWEQPKDDKGKDKDKVTPKSDSKSSSSSSKYQASKISDEARYQAGDIKNYAKTKGWKVSEEDVQDSDTLVRKKIKFSNSKHEFTVEQVTETLWAGGYDTKYNYDNKTWSKDEIKWTLNEYKVK